MDGLLFQCRSAVAIGTVSAGCISKPVLFILDSLLAPEVILSRHLYNCPKALEELKEETSVGNMSSTNLVLESFSWQRDKSPSIPRVPSLPHVTF